MLVRRPRVRVGTLSLLLLTMTACSPVWFLTRSDEVVLPLKLEEGLSQSVALVAKFPGRRYRVYLRFDRTIPFDDIQCLVGYLLVDRCPNLNRTRFLGTRSWLG